MPSCEKHISDGSDRRTAEDFESELLASFRAGESTGADHVDRRGGADVAAVGRNRGGRVARDGGVVTRSAVLIGGTVEGQLAGRSAEAVERRVATATGDGDRQTADVGALAVSHGLHPGQAHIGQSLVRNVALSGERRGNRQCNDRSKCDQALHLKCLHSSKIKGADSGFNNRDLL
jgi:hypothetical protein